MTYALDTNTVSYILKGEGEASNHFKKEIVIKGQEYVIPYIVYYEVYRWLRNTSTCKMMKYESVFHYLFIHVQYKADLPINVWDTASSIYISLKQKGQIISDADIIIAGYCMSHDYTLVTHNTKDFNRIETLKIVDWY